MPFLYLFKGHGYTICKPTEACHLVLLHVWKHEYISYSVTVIKPLEDPHTKSPDWLQWQIQGKGLPPPPTPTPHLFLDQTEAKKNTFWVSPPPPSQNVDDRSPPSHPLIWGSGSATGLIPVHFIRVYVERSNYLLFGDHFINSCNLSTWLCYIILILQCTSCICWSFLGPKC